MRISAAFGHPFRKHPDSVSELSGQHNGTFGHLVEQIKKLVLFNQERLKGANDEETGDAESKRNAAIEIRSRIICTRYR
jgi:hypothetical protein